MPFAIRRLGNDANEKVYDFSGNGFGNDAISDNCNEFVEEASEAVVPCENTNSYTDVRSMSLNTFCQKLIMHYNIMFHML